MNDASRRCDTHPDLVSFKYPLPRLKTALQQQRSIKIVAIGSSSTAGVDSVLPFPPRLEMLFRQKYPFRMIDVVNRGIGGQEAPDELLRFQSDVFDEEPVLVIWQVGTNAVYHDLDRGAVAAAIEVGLQWRLGYHADLVLMDLQYTQAMVDKLDAARDMVSRIAKAAEKAEVNVFKRFALMERWVGDHIPIGELQDGDLHTGEWATNCITRALFEAIMRAVAPEGTT